MCTWCLICWYFKYSLVDVLLIFYWILVWHHVYCLIILNVLDIFLLYCITLYIVRVAYEETKTRYDMCIYMCTFFYDEMCVMYVYVWINDIVLQTPHCSSVVTLLCDLPWTCLLLWFVLYFCFKFYNTFLLVSLIKVNESCLLCSYVCS